MGREAIKDEIVRCGLDPSYFINQYVRIQHPVRGLVPFKLFDYQEQLIEDYQKNRFNIVLKGRQIGISELTAAYATWLILFHRNKNILVMATKADTAKNIIRKVKLAIAKLPEWLIISDVLTDNAMSVELSNGSRIKAISSSSDAGRSEALSLMIIDEAAFVKNLDELWTGLLPTVSAGGNVIVLSTPNGVGNKFHTLYQEAVEGKNEFHHSKLMWWVHPERISDLADDPDRPGFKTSSWYRNEIKKANMSPRDVAQELECNFNASGDTVLSPESIEWIYQGCFEPTMREHWDRNLFVWWPPEPQKRYFISVDVSRGDGKDYSSAHVWNAEEMEQCAEYYGKIPVEEFAHLLVDLGHRYNDALIVIENNNIGMACLEHIRMASYPNLYYSNRDSNKPGEAVHASWGATSDRLVIGFVMSQKMRPLVISKFEEFVRNRAIGIRSARLHNEITTFIWDGGRAEAMKGYNDDAVIAAAIGCWVKDTYISPGAQAASMAVRLLENIKAESHVNTETQGMSKNPDHVKQNTMGVFVTMGKPGPFEVRIPFAGSSRRESLKWLLK